MPANNDSSPPSLPLCGAADLPLREQIELTVRNWIAKGEYAPGEQLPTAREIAQMTGVNEQTIRRGLKNLIEEGLLRGAQGKGVFVAQNNARHRRIALILPNLEDELTVQIARGAQSVFDKAGLQCLILDAGRDAEKEDTNIANLSELPVDGAIIFPIAYGSITERIIALKMAAFPFVLVDKYIPNIDTDCVLADDYSGMYALTTGLIGRGYRQFGWISGEAGTSTVTDRFEGFRWALGDHGIPLPRRQAQEIATGSPTADPAEQIRQALDKLLEQTPRPEVIVCANDLIARQSIGILQERRIRVPEDIGVSGFDDLQQNRELGLSITSARKPIAEMGATAAELLLSRLSPAQQPTRRIVLPVEPVFRASTR